MKYDNRLNYSGKKLITLELFFLFNYLTIGAIAYKIGIHRLKIERVVKEWTENDGYLIVESKL